MRYFGVGFGQEKAGQPNGTPDKNAFLNVIKINGAAVTSFAKGYVITPQGVTLGLTAANTAGFRFAKLEPNPPYGDWKRIPATITANGVSGPGTMLTDTGISYSYLTPPTGASVATIPVETARGKCVQFKPCAAPGTVISVAVGDPASPALSYSITIGAEGIPVPAASAPGWVTVNVRGLSPFLNTSYHFFNVFNYVYDFADGIVGFQAR